MGIGGGGTTGVGASIGVAIAENLMGFDSDGNAVARCERARLAGLHRRFACRCGGHDLTLDAESSMQDINSVVIAGSVALAAGGTAPALL